MESNHIKLLRSYIGILQEEIKALEMFSDFGLASASDIEMINKKKKEIAEYEAKIKMWNKLMEGVCYV